MKKFLKFCEKVFKNFWVQLVFLVVFATIIFVFGGVVANESIGKKALELVTGTDLLSIFLAATFSLIVAKVAIKIKHTLEESLKLEDDHHKIISKYCGHAAPGAHDGNAFVKDGEFMRLTRVPEVRKRPGNMVDDKFSKEYKFRTDDIDGYTDKCKLLISGINVFLNKQGNTQIVFRDKKDMYEMPAFIGQHAESLLEAHGGSSIRNNVTVRLNDVAYDNNTLTLYTQRSMYFHMLVTNRCMDYKLDDRITVREIYESGNKVSPLSESKLCNQIGINGLVFTSDGYVLIEKRGKNKTTWKDKFAQPISLALKEDEFVQDKGTMADTPEAASAAMKKIIFKTLTKNYGLGEDDCLPFSAEKNFLGLARDLIEGGKPNMYFYVVTKTNAEQLRDKLQKEAAEFTLIRQNELHIDAQKPKIVVGFAGREQSDEADECNGSAKETDNNSKLPYLVKEKMDSDLYLVNLRDLCVNFGYNMKIKADSMIYIHRKFYPRVKRMEQKFDGAANKIRKSLGLSLKKECGEALLACLYYADECMDRLSQEIRFQ